MATSGTYAFAPTIESVISEAFERAGIDDSQIQDANRASARFSLNLIFISWFNSGLKRWLVEQKTVTLTDGDSTPTIDARMIDIIDMVLRRSDVDTPMTALTAKDYLEIADKTQEGRPDRYWVNRPQTGAVLTLWPVPENSTDAIVYNQLRRAADVSDANAGISTETPDIDYLYYDALCAELAKRVSLKFNPARYDRLRYEAREAFLLAKHEGRERGELRMTVRYGR